jgi:hypothetical protein
MSMVMDDKTSVMVSVEVNCVLSAEDVHLLVAYCKVRETTPPWVGTWTVEDALRVFAKLGMQDRLDAKRKELGLAKPTVIEWTKPGELPEHLKENR